MNIERFCSRSAVGTGVSLLHEKLERWRSLKWDRKWQEEQVCCETNMPCEPEVPDAEAGTQVSMPGSHGSSV